MRDGRGGKQERGGSDGKREIAKGEERVEVGKRSREEG